MNQKGEPEENFFRVSHLIVESEKFKILKPSSKILYYGLCKLRNRFADKNGIFWRADRVLTKDVGLGRNSIWRARHELIKTGLIKWKKGGSHRACRYQIND